MKIKEDMHIREIIRKYPETVKIFNKYNMDCISCGGAENESLMNAAIMYGIDINIILKELNDIAGKQKYE